MRAPLFLLVTLAAPSIALGQAAPSPVPPPPGATPGQPGSAPAGGLGSGGVTPQPGAPSAGVALSPVQVSTATPGCPPAADALYSEGMNRMAQGDDAGAAVLFTRTLELCPSHPTAGDMRSNAVRHQQASGAAMSPPATNPPATTTAQATAAPAGSITVEAANGWTYSAPIPNYNLVYGPDPVAFGARVNLVTGQAIAGLALGAFVAGTFSNRGEHIAAGMLLGGALGIAGSLVGSMGGVTQGQAIAVNMGSGIGVGVGFGIALLANASSANVALGLAAGGLALGTLGGAVLAMRRPLSGSMAYVSSMVGWTTVATTHLWLGAGGGRGATPQVIGAVLTGGLVGGTLLGALTAPYVHLSADRMGWIDLSMSLGMLVVGGSTALFASSSGGADIAWAWGAVAGAGLGALFGVLMTNNMDAFWHRAHEMQTRQTTAGASSPARALARARTTRREGLPLDVRMSPGGAQSPFGLTFAGAF
jgi:hypothetical protein